MNTYTDTDWKLLDSLAEMTVEARKHIDLDSYYNLSQEELFRLLVNPLCNFAILWGNEALEQTMDKLMAGLRNTADIGSELHDAYVELVNIKMVESSEGL